MTFRFLKKLAEGTKAKTYSGIHGTNKFTWRITKTGRTNIKRIMVFGDSNAYRPGNSKKSWPKLLEAKDPLHFIVFNESCDGRTTRYDIGECNGLSVIAEKLAVYKPLDYVVVLLGTNDVKNKYGPPNSAEIAEGMSRIFEIIKNQTDGTKPILLTPPPLGNVNSGELAGAQPRIPSVAVEYRQLSKNRNVPLIDIYSILEVNTDLEADMIHLNAVGRKKIAKTMWAYLQEVNPPLYS
jgi:lysophospholipase L1-like esterase